MTLGEWKAKIDVWMTEKVKDVVKMDATNDAVESLWMSALKANLSLFLGGPVTLQLEVGTERQQLVTVTDPAVPATAVAVAQGALPLRNLSIYYTIVMDSGAETNLSPVLSFACPQNNVVQVNPPTRVALPGVLGWNVYIGSSPQNAARQNPIPITFSQSFVESNNGSIDAPDAPMPPTENTTADDIFYIKHLELALTSGGYKVWEQGDIDNQLFRFAARGIASASEYQSYAYDLVNMRTFEVRPALGMGLSPRYFYIHKPRRMKFDASNFPFFSFPSEKYLRYATMSGCHSHLQEWTASQNCAKIAEEALLEVTTAIAQMNWGKDQFVQPYMI